MQQKEEEEEEGGRGEGGENEPQKEKTSRNESVQIYSKRKLSYFLTVLILLFAQRIGDQVFLVPYNSPNFLTQTLFEGTDAQPLMCHENGASWIKSQRYSYSTSPHILLENLPRPCYSSFLSRLSSHTFTWFMMFPILLGRNYFYICCSNRTKGTSHL